MKRSLQHFKIPNLALIATIPAAMALIFGPGRALAQRPLGVDVSDIQSNPTPTWTTVQGTGISFAWSKASEGTGYTASSFSGNMTQGKAAGVLMGAYDFARPDLVSPGPEADFFWSVAGGYIKSDGLTLQPMLDYETFQGLVGASSYASWAETWRNELIADGGSGLPLKPVMYTTTCEACNVNSSCANFIPWIANPSGENAQTGSPWDYTSCDSCDWWGGWNIWQYSWSGSVSGIAQTVDLDCFNGGLASMIIADVVDGHKRIDSYAGNDGSGIIQIFSPDNVNNLESIYQTCANCGWTSWGSAGDPTPTAGVPASVGYNADLRMQIFVRGDDNNMWTFWKTALNGGWSSWNNYSGNLAGNVTVGYLNNGAMQLFARSSSNTVQTIWQNGPNAGWTAWSDMGGSAYGDPVCGFNADGRMQLFVRTSSNTVDSNWKLSNGSWHGWSDYGGGCYGKPAVANLENGAMQVFVRSSSNTVQTIAQTGPNAGWGSWTDMGGDCQGDPIVGYNADGRLQLFIPTSTGAISAAYKLTTSPSSSWSSWSSDGGNYGSQLTIAYNADGRMQLFMRDPSNVMWSMWQTAVNGGWNTWQNYGGNSPTVSITTQPSSQTVTVGQNATFSVVAANALTYQWTFNGGNISGATASSYTINNAQSSNAGNYAVVVANNGGSLTSSTATLTVNGSTPPSITTQPASQTVNQGQNATFSVVATGSAPLSYQWMFNGGNISGATASSYTVVSAQSSNAGGYSVKVSNSAGNVTSSTATLTVNVPPSITTQPASQTVNQGQNATFSVVATGTAPLSYQWTFGGANISGATTSSYTVTSAQPSNVGNYAVVVSNVAGNVTSANATLTVNVPPSITTQPASQTVNQGQNATFSVVASGTAPLSYQWTFNGANISGATLSSYTVTSAQPSNAGNYAVQVSNVAGNVTSSTATLTVNVPPSITTQPAGLTVKQGQNATFSVVATGTAPLSYQWTFNGANISGATASSYTVSNVQLNNSGNYAVVVSNVAGNVTSANAALGVDPHSNPFVSINADGRQELFVVGSDGTIYHSYQTAINSTNWSSWASLGGSFNLGAVIAGGINGNNEIEIFAIETNGAMYHIWQQAANTTNNWNTWQSLGGTWSTTATVASIKDGSGRRFVFVVGTNNALYYAYYSSSWSSWTSLGGTWSQSGDVAVRDDLDGYINVFLVGSTGNLYTIYQTSTVATSFNSSFDNLSGTFSQSDRIAAGSNSDGRVEVFLLNTSGVLYHNWETTPNGIFQSSNWSALGTNTWSASAKPIVGNDQNGNQHVFMIGTSGAMQHIYQAPGWSSWASLGGSFAQNASPFVAKNQNGEVEVYCVATGYDLEANFEISVNGQGSWNGWANPVPGGTLFY